MQPGQRESCVQRGLRAYGLAVAAHPALFAGMLLALSAGICLVGWVAHTGKMMSMTAIFVIIGLAHSVIVLAAFLALEGPLLARRRPAPDVEAVETSTDSTEAYPTVLGGGLKTDESAKEPRKEHRVATQTGAKDSAPDGVAYNIVKNEKKGPLKPGEFFKGKQGKHHDVLTMERMASTPVNNSSPPCAFFPNKV